MASLYINGGSLLKGRVRVSGSKNGSLALMAASLLTNEESTLFDVPDVSDVHNFRLLFETLGVGTSFISNILKLKTDRLQSADVCPKTCGAIRASILLLGPLLARFGHATVPLPGGCAIGERPIDQHLLGLEKLGTTITMDLNGEGGAVCARAPLGGLKGGVVDFDCPTVTGTINIMLAASMAHGETTIRNAAMEPEIVDVAMCLASMGCNIKGAGTGQITIHGSYGRPLKACRYTTMKDRIECGTLLIAGAMLGNPLTIEGCEYEHQRVLIDTLRLAGARIIEEHHEKSSTVKVYRTKRPKSVSISTGPYPLFPTDLQPQFMALLAIAKGSGTITENVFETRFGQIAGLNSMGANITLAQGGKMAMIRGARRLSSSRFASTDLRCAAALLLAALVARGTSTLESTEHLDRGYDCIE